jgi:hypothetical protein
MARWESKAPALKLRQAFPLPMPGGHDLSPTPNRAALYITTDTGVVLFDLQSKAFRSEPSMNQLAFVKSVDVHPITKRLAYIQPEGGHWWSSHIHFLAPDQAKASQTIVLEGERLYKARWIY